MAYEAEIQWLKKNKQALQNLYGLRVDMVCMYLQSGKLEKAKKDGGQLIEGMLKLEDEHARIEFLEAQLAAKKQLKKKHARFPKERAKIAERVKKRKDRGLPPEQQPYPPLTHYVPQGHYHTLDNTLNLKLGTRGCGTCVGVVAKMTGNRMFCCHLDHDIGVAEPRNFAMRTRWHDFKESLLSRLPSAEHVTQMNMTTAANNWVSQRTWEAIKMIYGRKYIGPNKWKPGRDSEEKEDTMMHPAYTAIWWDGSRNRIERTVERGNYVGDQVGGELGTIILVGEHLVLSNDDTREIEGMLRRGTYPPRR
jgi:hypothetical protein